MEINIKWNICRVCLVEEQKRPPKAGTVDPMLNIFNDDEILAQQIFECSGITMKPNDNLPEKICKNCLTMIKYAVNFRKTCRASDTYLQSVLQRTKSATRLFKPAERPLENPSEEILSDDPTCNANIDSEMGESDDSNVLKPSKIFKRKRTEYSDKTTTKLDKKLNSTEMINISEDLIELEDEVSICANDLNIEQLNYDGNEDSQIDTNELIYEGDDFEGNEQTDSNDSKEDSNAHAEFIEKELIHEHSKEIYDAEDENESKKETLDHSKTDMDENQEQVTSTVPTIIVMKEEDNSLSTENNQQKEYILNEYLIDGNSSDVSLQNSTTVGIKSKRSKRTTHDSSNKTSAVDKSSLKGNSEHMVWICDLCGNNFTNRNALNIHMKIHRQEKKHECEICSKRFITACNLQAHMRIHTGEKPFQCQYCFRRFSDRSSNLRHERIHTNVKPYQCKECGKAFSLATTLKKHLTVHSGERSYRCDICEKSFRLPHQLKAHKKTSAHRAAEQLV